MTKKTDTEPMSREWHWHPDLPVKHAPYWLWPPNPAALAKWVWQNWLQFSDRSIFLVLAFLVAFWLQPVGPEQATSALAGWHGYFCATGYFWASLPEVYTTGSMESTGRANC
ncbi:hypothetical protein C1J03_24765 (plasmid) [Sulfitobacter sp. SK012]|uniref:hypothetical protein n=1 Tax=Sulfitobacter sp. SK012 TaxID=1389005 RepID=UPI000E0B31FC|nr:hypothetical protein [Sulfitobacter sp. SK012]AXI49322.1 hypothetical protein C1J03_24765 [Sulfitobacter sp. SK012]